MLVDGRVMHRWSKEFLEADKKRLAGDTVRAATSDEVKDLRREARAATVDRGGAAVMKRYRLRINHIEVFQIRGRG